MLFKRKKRLTYIKEWSNVIQFDSMGYPLRLVITSDNEHRWVDTTEKENDVVLKWHSVPV